jgi:AraC family transcriptional activator of pobA
LNNYLCSEKPHIIGLPSISYCADELNLSPNYFGNLVKKETGKTAQEYIHSKLINMVKKKLFDNNKTISQVA